MIDKKINTNSGKSRVLLVPLDWGLGHATRCIPLIRALTENGAEVFIGAETAVYSLLKHEFQQVTFIPLKGYRISYSKHKAWLPVKIALQIPRILTSIYKEHFWLKKVVKKYDINAIVSDNRFGLWHRGIPSVYITHQLLIKTGNAAVEKLLQKIHFYFIKKFTHCWVPDFAGEINIAGQLSHPSTMPGNIKYIGGFSRFINKVDIEKKYHLLILISGPEPQRTIFENICLLQIKSFDGKVILIRGLPITNGQPNKIPASGTDCRELTVKDHLPSDELNRAILQSELVICRSGYTTVMDLIRLKQKAILVPTPGQTEQEYLAGHLMQRNVFLCAAQHEFQLSQVLNSAADFKGRFDNYDMEQYKAIVKQFVDSL